MHAELWECCVYLSLGAVGWSNGKGGETGKNAEAERRVADEEAAPTSGFCSLVFQHLKNNHH